MGPKRNKKPTAPETLPAENVSFSEPDKPLPQHEPLSESAGRFPYYQLLLITITTSVTTIVVVW
jgi:hypothetical protein